MLYFTSDTFPFTEVKAVTFPGGRSYTLTSCWELAALFVSALFYLPWHLFYWHLDEAFYFFMCNLYFLINILHDMWPLACGFVCFFQTVLSKPSDCPQRWEVILRGVPIARMELVDHDVAAFLWQLYCLECIVVLLLTRGGEDFH